MGYVDFILNLAGLLLWLNWRSLRFDPLGRRTPATLMGTLRPAMPKKLRRWHFVLFILGLLFLRAVVYWWLAPFWVGKLDLGVTVPPFRSDSFDDMLVFSFFSFGLTLGIFYVGLLLLSLLQGPEPIHGLVKIPLGRVDGWPRWAKILLPLLVTALVWWLASWLLVRLQILPPTISVLQRLEQSVVIGLNGYLVWKYPVATILALYLLNSYIYFGRQPFWKYVNATAQKLLRPLRSIPLQLGRVDLAPLVGIIIVFLATNLIEQGIHTKLFSVPGLVDLYRKLPF